MRAVAINCESTWPDWRGDTFSTIAIQLPNHLPLVSNDATQPCYTNLKICVFNMFYNNLSVQAEITDGVIDMLENETNPITFSCKAIGEPVPNIGWYFNGELIDVSNASKYIVSNSSNGTTVTSLLTIMNTQSSDVGRYTCFAENIIGSDQSSGVLTVNGKCCLTRHAPAFDQHAPGFL